jgi:hypothetical protein
MHSTTRSAGPTFGRTAALSVAILSFGLGVGLVGPVAAGAATKTTTKATTKPKATTKAATKTTAKTTAKAATKATVKATPKKSAAMPAAPAGMCAELAKVVDKATESITLDTTDPFILGRDAARAGYAIYSAAAKLLPEPIRSDAVKVAAGSKKVMDAYNKADPKSTAAETLALDTTSPEVFDASVRVDAYIEAKCPA